MQNFLGIYIDEDLRWNHHIDHTLPKIAHSLYLLWTIKEYYIKMTWRYTIIYSYITLGIEVWGSVSKVFLDRIYIIQNRIIHCIGNSHYLEHTLPIFKRLHILKIEELFKLYVLKQMPIYFKNESPKPIGELFPK